MNTEKRLYQWDTGQKLVGCTGLYVDFPIGNEVYRVETTDGMCIIPDELLQTSGSHKVYECMTNNTIRSFAFSVTPRPKPPDYVYTPTERLTFEGLVQKVDDAVADMIRRADSGEFDGYTPIKGTDYFTASEIQQIQNEVSSGAIGEFKTVVDTETETFNANATEKVNTYNQNDSEKTASYNANATKKLNAYNANADNRVAEFDAHTEQIQTDISELKSDLINLEEVTVIKKERIVTEDIDSSLTWSSGYMGANGDIHSNSLYTYSNKIKVNEGDVIKFSEVGSNYFFRFITAFSNGSVVTSKGNDNGTSTYTVPSGIDEIVLTILSGISGIIKVYNETYFENIYDGDIVKLKDEVKSLSGDINEVIESKQIHYNLLNLNALTNGKYLGDGGLLLTNTSYKASDYIEVEEGEDYTYQITVNGIRYIPKNGINQIAGYDENKEFVTGSFGSYVNPYTVPSGVKYIRFSSDGIMDEYYPAFVKGTNVLPYEEYSLENHYVRIVKKSVIPFIQYVPNGLRYSFNIDDNNEFVEDIHMNHMFNYCISFKADISTFTSLEISKGANLFYGMRIVIDDTNICNYENSSTEPKWTYSHNLTFKDYILVKIDAIAKVKAKVQILTNGGKFETEMYWDARMSKLSAKVTGGAMSNCKLGYYCYALDSDTWLFGDSYFSSYDTSRWTAYLVDTGHSNYLLDGYGGRASGKGYTSLIESLKINIPKRIVWCIGMNDADSDTTANTDWIKYVESIIEVCKEKDIELILATIPNVAENNNSFKNEYVRNSGYRYIDFASAVGASDDTTWYDNMLYSDGVHPDIEGAKALYAQAIVDVPELLS